MEYTVITATLTARTAPHIGSGNENDLTDALIRRDGAGRPLIPGTAIAGALRTLLTRLGPRLGTGECQALKKEETKEPCQCGVCYLFGDVNPGDEVDNAAEASRLLVFNAVLTPQQDASTTIRDGVGINRVTGAAARAGAVKFDLEVLPAGTKFSLRLELRHQTAEDETLLAAALAEWQAGRAWLGGRVARGLGAFDLSNVQMHRLDLNESTTLKNFLTEDEPHTLAQPDDSWLSEKAKAVQITPSGNPYAARTWFSLTATLQATGPLLTSDAFSSGVSGFDYAPLLAQGGNWTNPVLTGAGLRGVIRSHAERLARTLATHNAKDKNEFLNSCPACSPVEGEAKKPLASCDALLKGVVSTDSEVEDQHLCLACYLFGSARRGSRLFIEDAPHCGNGHPKLKMLDFLAIDRFTGGGADGAKFDALALWRPAFNLRLCLENPEPWELGWLALTLRDMQTEWLSVGMGAAKGFGRVKLENLQMQLGYLSPDDVTDFNERAKQQMNKQDLEKTNFADFALKPGSSTRSNGLYYTTPVTFANAQPWLSAFKQEVADFSRTKGKILLQKDSYFGVVDELYLKEVTL